MKIYTVYDREWNALENGDLINEMEKDSFDYLLTSDKNLQHQQNLTKYSIGLSYYMLQIIIMKLFCQCLKDNGDFE